MEFDELIDRIEPKLEQLGLKYSGYTDLLDGSDLGYHVAHGDVAAAIEAISRLSAAPDAQLRRMGTTARELLAARFRQNYLCGRFCDRLEQALGLNHG